MISAFTYIARPSKVIFGAGASAGIRDAVDRISGRRAIILSTPQQIADADKLTQQLAGMAVATFTEAAMHTPVNVTEKAVEVVKANAADCIVAIGGGSTTGLSKAIALRTNLPQIIVPTTYAGSEVTDILGQTENGEKTTTRDPRVLPEVVIYDPELTLGLPGQISVMSGLNAMAHAAEALYAPDRNPITSLMAVEGLKSMKESLPRVLSAPDDLAGRTNALYGAWLCGTVLGAVAMSLHHKLCHTLGGSFDTPHAETHSILLPHTIDFNESAVPDLMASAAQHFGGRLGAGLWDFAASLGAPTRLRDLGLSSSDLDRAAAIATRRPYQNPRKINYEAIRAILQRAWHGERPET